MQIFDARFFNYLRKLLIFQEKIIYCATLTQSLFNRKYFHSLSPLLPILTLRKLPIDLRFLVVRCLGVHIFHDEEVTKRLRKLTQGMRGY